MLTVTEKGWDEPYMHSESSDIIGCVAAVSILDLGDPYDDTWILGDLFLSAYYTVYYKVNKKIGIAKAVS